MIRLGVNVPNFGPETSFEVFAEWAAFLEGNGFATLVVSDHVAPTPEVSSLYPPPFHDPFILLTWLAGRTTTLRLGTSVVVLPYRHPLLTARMSAMLAVASGGRFVLGVGSGWAATEFAALGLDFTARGATTEAYLDLIVRAWAQPDVDGVATAPHPPGGRVPLWVGGAGRAPIRRAARLGTAWHPINPRLEWLRDTGVPGLSAAAAALGRPLPELVPRIKARLQPAPAPADRPLGVGTLDQVVADVAALASLGAAEVVLDPNPDAPRPRDFAVERAHLLEIKQAYAAGVSSAEVAGASGHDGQ
jgi:alkanesulfonate monooxygenase SsuD/methylene tetrahydromethanopterin reductase-like flavin-dependent oxidoreductase (luciferase family)